MSILYSVIARGTTVLAKYATCSGNFSEVTEQIMEKIPAENHKLTYSHDTYLFHYICENRIIYMCITDDVVTLFLSPPEERIKVSRDVDFERIRAFSFLSDIKQRFLATYGSRADTALGYSMNTEFAPYLANQMKHYNEAHELDSISRVRGDINELKDIMVKNIENVARRGERLELLVNKTENLSANSVTFRKTSRNLARSMFWKNVKLYIIIAVVVIVIIYFIISMACGGLAWNNCVGN